ncbi:MAG TPA: protein translocase subunit SecD, partial [Phycisphaerales bacterium]|nr:protein translocase subunit SecD [Phycisphaerales bacterium]
MRHIFKMAFVVVAVLVFFAWTIMPPEKTLRRGKDLAGGVSMTYAVDIGPNEDAKQVLDSTIKVLKERVDPEGVMDISMVSQGRDRIEINMPLPSDEVKAARKAFEDALADLGRNKLTDQRLQLAMQMAGEQRAAEIKTLAAGNPKREELLNAAAKAYDDAQKIRAAYDAELESSKRDAMVEQVASAEIAYANARDAVLKTALSPADIRKIITASTRVRYIDDNGQKVPLPTAREVADKQVRNSHPDSIADIDRLLKLHEEYAKVRTTLDDPQDLVRLLRGAGVLEFRIAPRVGQHREEGRLRADLLTMGPRNVQSADTKWLKINQLENWLNTKAEVDALAENPANASAIFARLGYVAEPYGGDYYMLVYDTRQTRLTQAEGEWRVSRAFQGFDQRGRPAINFEMDPQGAKLLSQLTGAHVNEPMAVILDDQVYTAPNLNGEISSNGQIMGEFSKEELEYIIRVLGGGSLQAKLSPEPISIQSVGPELGADNLEKGITTAIWSAIIVAVFMCFYYFWYGAVAVIALLANALIIVGCMALSKAVFTMPGIAGLILTFGMAVDSNVLIYERIREEMNRGADMKTCVRLGFDKALSAIVDGNMTNLIVCVVLYYTGTPEIRGFAITMGIGVVATMSATLIVSRLIFDMMLAGGWRKGSVVSTHMLPTAIPSLQAWLTPNVDWMKYRFAFFAISAVYVSIGLGMVFWQGGKMLDNEFRGGTQVTLQFKPDPSDPEKRVMMTRKDVEEKVRGLAETSKIPDFNQFEVFPVNPQPDGITSDRFAIKTLAQNNATSPVLDVIKE